MEKLCSLCKASVDSEDAAILTLGGFGNAKYLCKECDEQLSIMTRGRDVDEIDKAIATLTDRMRSAGIDDAFTLKTMNSIISEAKARRDSIEKGEYDFSEEEEEDSIAEEIPEELRENEEDRLVAEKEKEDSKKWDKIITIVSSVVFTAVIGFLVYKFISGYFL